MKKSIYLIAILTQVYLSSCKVTEVNLVGLYKMKNFPKSILIIKSDTTFEFIKNYPNPYLLPFEHPEENYFLTTGSWTLKNNILSLYSTADSLTYSLYDIESSDTSQSKFCSYVFYDIFNDTVPILFVRTSKGDISRIHNTMKDFSYDKTKKDSLQFFFFGYRPLTIVNSQNGETNYKVFLQPEFRPNWFNDTKFKPTKNKLKHLKSGVVFTKYKGKMKSRVGKGEFHH